jgi:hypothetical protein
MIGNLCDSFFYDHLFEILIYILTNDNVLIWNGIMDYEYVLSFFEEQGVPVVKKMKNECLNEFVEDTYILKYSFKEWS